MWSSIVGGDWRKSSGPHFSGSAMRGSMGTGRTAVVSENVAEVIKYVTKPADLDEPRQPANCAGLAAALHLWLKLAQPYGGARCSRPGN
jgi:hypothetical protein